MLMSKHFAKFCPKIVCPWNMDKRHRKSWHCFGKKFGTQKEYFRLSRCYLTKSIFFCNFRIISRFSRSSKKVPFPPALHFRFEIKTNSNHSSLAFWSPSPVSRTYVRVLHGKFLFWMALSRHVDDKWTRISMTTIPYIINSQSGKRSRAWKGQ